MVSMYQHTHRAPGQSLQRPRQGRVVVGVVALLTGSAGAPAWAESPPQGSYLLNCKDSRVVGRTLESNCKSRGGQFLETRLEDFRACVGDIANSNGTLVCERGAPAPFGPYSQSCRDSYVSGNTLHGTCLDAGGTWRKTELVGVTQCLGQISNVEGQLQCNQGTTPPRGSYLATCRDSFVNSTTLRSTCKNAAGMWQPTHLDNYRLCRGGIANVNGELRCSGESVVAVDTKVEGCRGLELNGNVLSATCMTAVGRWQPTFLADPETCQSPVRNDGGRLTCERGNATTRAKP